VALRAFKDLLRFLLHLTRGPKKVATVENKKSANESYGDMNFDTSR